ncbi:MAG: outer membrane protein [Blastocatellia bacterium]|jgi:Skp family chaperone for outer membrane proteins|nr:outer membrane protein [Blastocatellia bacterium]
MNRTFLTLAFALVAFGSVARAQAPAQPRPSTTVANVPVSKMAVIYSEAFQDPKSGITRFTVTLNKLNTEFQKVQDDLTQTAQRLKGLQEEITRLQQAGATTPAQIQTKIDTLDAQKRDYTRKGEDAKAQYQKRYQELFLPLQEDVSKALDVYGKARGLTMIIDGSQTPILYAVESMDITRAFISDYNSKNPATAQATPAK